MTDACATTSEDDTSRTSRKLINLWWYEQKKETCSSTYCSQQGHENPNHKDLC